MKKYAMKLDGGIYRLTIPTVFPTGDTHCYLGEGDDGWVVVDVGVNVPEAKQIWENGLKEIGIGFSDISSIYLTHNHPDHGGLAGWFQQQSGANVFISADDIRALGIYNLPENEHELMLKDKMGPHGISEEYIKTFVKDIGSIMHTYLPFPMISPLKKDHRFRLGDDIYQPAAVPGHSDGHMVFLGLNKGRLLSGDALLGDWIPQASDWPYSALDNPIGLNLEALKELAKNPLNTVLPGHGNSFTGVMERVEAVEKQHERRMSKIERTLLGKEMTLFEICSEINVGARVLQEMRVSWADTLGYLELLCFRGRVEKRIGGLINFSIKE
ncbi:MAG: MBL fold metallo-hydrolase [Chitinophagales bacterium]